MSEKTKLTDMTTGNTMGHILRFSVPLIIGNVFQQLYNMVDTIIVGNYVDSQALAAVGTCGSTGYLFFSLSAGVAIGVGILVAQYFGAKDESHVKETIANSFYILSFVSVLISILGFVFAPHILRLLQTPAEILPDAVLYQRTTCVGLFSVALYNGVSSILRALGDSKTPLYFLIISSIINVVLDLIFVLQFRMGVFGVGLATVISQIVSMVASVVYAHKAVSYFQLTKQEWKPNITIMKKTFGMGIPMALQNSVIAISMMALQGVVNGFGPVVMAAYTVVSRVEQLVQQPYQSLGTAITTYSGQNMGAAKPERVKKGFRVSVMLALVFSILLIPVAYLFGEQIISCFVEESEVIAIGVKALRINSLFYFGLGMIYVPRAVLNGCGDKGFAMINGMMEVICRIVYSHVLTSVPMIGFWGIWITTGLTWTTTAVVSVIRYFSGKWRDKAITDTDNTVKIGFRVSKTC